MCLWIFSFIYLLEAKSQVNNIGNESFIEILSIQKSLKEMSSINSPLEKKCEIIPDEVNHELPYDDKKPLRFPQSP